MYDYSAGIRNKNHKPDYNVLTAKAILKVDIRTGKVLVDRLNKLDDGFGVLDDETTTD